jgi:hypothetical protein
MAGAEKRAWSGELQTGVSMRRLVARGLSSAAHFSSSRRRPAVPECAVDLWSGKATVDGTTRDPAPIDFEAMNASGWRFGAAFDRGYCPRPE